MNTPPPKYRCGMFGGKFMPFHKGHLYCLETASRLCEHVRQILMAGSPNEERILRNLPPDRREALSPERRFERMKAAGDRLGNVETILLDISACRTPEGAEDWDAETPLVLARCGRFDAVFGSEPSYAEYFARAYPWAEYVLVDPPRLRCPVSGTALREGRADPAFWII